MKPISSEIVPIKFRIVRTQIKFVMENEKMETDENFDIITISSNDVTPPGW